MAHDPTPTRTEVETMRGPVPLEFGAAWCGICRSLQPTIRAALERHPGVKHVQIEDGPGQPLGRSFGVKLWPTLVFLRDGHEVARTVRPRDGQALEAALRDLAQAAA